MRLCAVVSEAIHQAMLDDTWLACFDWVFLDSIHDAALAGADLLVVGSPADLSALAPHAITSPCWCFDAADANWDWPFAVDLLRQALSVAILSERLLAWLWINNQLCPASFAGERLIVSNGSVSLVTAQPTHYLLQMTVSPMGDTGGDVAFYSESASHALVVLGDAIGHGPEAALDAALFILLLMRERAYTSLARLDLAQFSRSLRQHLAQGRFVAAAMLEINPVKQNMTLMNAGMPPVWVMGQQGLQASYPSTHPPLGLELELAAGATRTLPLLPASQWMLMSDGVDWAQLKAFLERASLMFSSCGQALPRLPLDEFLPLHKLRENQDDASQIIVFLPEE